MKEVCSNCKYFEPKEIKALKDGSKKEVADLYKPDILKLQLAKLVDGETDTQCYRCLYNVLKKVSGMFPDTKIGPKKFNRNQGKDFSNKRINHIHNSKVLKNLTRIK